MKVTEFVEEYKKSDNTEQFLADRILADTYVSYFEKVTICTRIVDVSSHTKSEPRLYRRNSPVQYMLFVLNIINKYTDIEIDFSKGIEEFDLISRAGLVSELLEYIPETEYSEFSNVLNMIVEDDYANNRDITSFLETKLESFSMVFKAFSDVMTPDNLQKILEKVNEQNTIQ